MKQQKKASIRLLAAALAVCLLLPLVGCGGREPQPATEVERLSKLCRVWGYVKYTHPAFLLGQKDWDEELLALIPQVRELETHEEVNALLHEWFAGLGEIDYGNCEPVAFWAEAAEEDKVVITDTSWTTDAGYLGEELAGDLGKLGEVPHIKVSTTPVQYKTSKYLSEVTGPIFRENDLKDMDYSDVRFRLLGLFRLWNAVEYYFPYHNLLEKDWVSTLDEFIPRMLAGGEGLPDGFTPGALALMGGEDFQSYVAAITALLVRMNDFHVVGGLLGMTYAPIPVMEAEGKLVVFGTAEGCPLLPGDVIQEVNGRDIYEFAETVKEYLPYSRDEVYLSRNGAFILSLAGDNKSEIEVTVLRDGKEETFFCACVSVEESPFIPYAQPQEVYEILEGNIGLVNPALLSTANQYGVMEELRDTDGLVIDLRQYPNLFPKTFPAYFVPESTPAFIHLNPSQAAPGAYIKTVSNVGCLPEDRERGVYYYDKPVVVLMDEFSQSGSEWMAWAIGKGEHVVLMGGNTAGALDGMAKLSIPGHFVDHFTAIGAYTDDGGQIQRTGLTPDIPVSRTIQGIREGRDELMEAAVEYIQNQSIK